MASLSKELRNQLARTTLAARAKAEEAAQAALENLAVHEREPRGHMSPAQRQLRNRLRARGRALGDRINPGKGTQDIDRLVELVAYENWHRMLFTRFLTSNNLLISDESMGSVPVTLADCEELASSEGAKDGFDLACRFASHTLPGVFRKDDPALEVTLAPNDRVALRELLDSIDDVTFQADDSLGWTYQFWQAQRKEDINKSGMTIEADELPAVTQLFTEDYMVEFLLHNTIGAWWAGRRGPITAATEAAARRQVGLPAKDGIPSIEWGYLRFIQNGETKSWLPAASTFDGWPTTTAQVTVLDPCMGSGHFLTFLLPILARLRMEEEDFGAADAIAAVIRDNIHGLELDLRCTQIGAFNVALTAWKLGGFQSLPPFHIACSGNAPHVEADDWTALAGTNEKLRNGMDRLYSLFNHAPVLGSLINPLVEEDPLLSAGFRELRPLLERAMSKESPLELLHETAVTASGLLEAAELLATRFTLVITNVPYLGRGDQPAPLKDYSKRYYPDSRADLATTFLENMLDRVHPRSTVAAVTPRIWMTYTKYYQKLRAKLLETQTWNLLGVLGKRAFGEIDGEVVDVVLVVLCRTIPKDEQVLSVIDASQVSPAEAKAAALRDARLMATTQIKCLKQPGHVLITDDASLAPTTSKRLMDYAVVLEGLSRGDTERFDRFLWELPLVDGSMWSPLLESATERAPYGGCSTLFRWENGRGDMARSEGARVQGCEAWGRQAVFVSRTHLNAYLSNGAPHAQNGVAIVPHNTSLLPALWAYCSSEEYREEVLRLNQKLIKPTGALDKVPFDLARWEKIASREFPHGLPKPVSTDPTQWLFNGHPKDSDNPLHVAVARLLGYQWPRQTGSSFPDCPALGPDGLENFADDDGIVCLPAIHREPPAATRLRALLTEAYGSYSEATLLSQAGGKPDSIEDWLRNEFFEQHCKLFQNRPFIWHIWDGRKDGFAALVNYHRLDENTLKKLAYSYLGDWIRQQEDEVRDDKPGAAERLGAAQDLQAELVAIVEGEAPYDIFVRWKPLAQQAIGWHPDLNDGVRLNIRPFLMAQDVGRRGAGVLRFRPNISWDKDRGKEPKRDKASFPWFWCDDEPDTDPSGSREFTGHRWNDVHLSLDFKRAARKRPPA
jgi:hypothetical protein